SHNGQTTMPHFRAARPLLCNALGVPFSNTIHAVPCPGAITTGRARSVGLCLAHLVSYGRLRKHMRLGKMRSVLARGAGAGMARGLGLGMLAPVLADDRTGNDGRDGTMQIRVIVEGQTLTATLDDTDVARDFASLLPLELTLSDYNATEKVGDLPRKLSTDGAPRSYRPSA